jgi:Icc-related predicted phosphoesterase
LILGGDIVGKGLVPILAENGTLSAVVHGEVVSVPRADEEGLRADLNRYGFYSRVVGKDDLSRLESDPGQLDAAFEEEITGQVRRWCDLADKRLAPNIRCLITPGNDDPSFIDPLLREAHRIESPEGQLCELGPVVIASLGDVTPTPWKTEREYPEEQLALRIAKLMNPAPRNQTVVFNFHCPPYASGLDTAPELDGMLRPVIRAGQPSMIPVGSTAVRDAIMTYKPVVGLHGHIHEGRGAQHVGTTLCLNPGSDYTSDILRGALVDIAADGSFLDFLLTAG